MKQGNDFPSVLLLSILQLLLIVGSNLLQDGVDAFPQFPGSCSSGAGSVGAPHAAEATGSVESGGYEVVVNGKVVVGGDTQLSPLYLDTLDTHTWSIRVNGGGMETGFLGFLAHVSDPKGVADVSDAISLHSDFEAVATIFNNVTQPACETGTAAAGHSMAIVKDEIGGSLDFDVHGDVVFGITIVSQNIPGANRWYYSEYALQIMTMTPPTVTVSPRPTVSPVLSPPSPTPTTATPTILKTKSQSPTRKGMCRATVDLRDDLTFVYGTYVDEDGRDVFQAKLVYEEEAWISLAVSPGARMIGSEAYIGVPTMETGTPNNPGVYDMSTYDPFGVTLKTPQTQTNPHIFDHAIEQDDGDTTLTFSRYLDDERLLPIHKDKPTILLYALGYDNNLNLHKIQSAFRIDLRKLCTDDADTNVVDKVAVTDGKESVWQVHGLLAGVAWAVATPLAVMSSLLRDIFVDRKGCCRINWFKTHLYLNMLTLVLTFVACAVAFLTFRSGRKPHFTKPHHTIGLVVFVLGSVQVVGGLLRPHVEPGNANDNAPPVITTRRKAWKLGHRVMGSTVLLLSFYQIFSGLRLYSDKYGVPDYSYAFGIWLGFLGTITFIKTRKRKSL